MITRILLTAEGKKFYVKDTDKGIHTRYGLISQADLDAAKDGDEVTTNTGKKMRIIPPGFMDLYLRIKRSPQIIPIKDLGTIAVETGLDKDSRVVDAGAGSGALACYLAHIAREVTTYEIREDYIEIVEHNKEFLGLSNLTIKKGSIYEDIEETDVDIMTLDTPEPWMAIGTAAKALKVGGYLMSYSPSITQTADFVNAFNTRDDFLVLRTVEVAQREWEIDERKVRPSTPLIKHSGFMTFLRKIK